MSCHPLAIPQFHQPKRRMGLQDFKQVFFFLLCIRNPFQQKHFWPALYSTWDPTVRRWESKKKNVCFASARNELLIELPFPWNARGANRRSPTSRVITDDGCSASNPNVQRAFTAAAAAAAVEAVAPLLPNYSGWNAAWTAGRLTVTRRADNLSGWTAQDISKAVALSGARHAAPKPNTACIR